MYVDPMLYAAEELASDFVVGYTIRDYGGAYNAIKYAKEQGKRVLLV